MLDNHQQDKVLSGSIAEAVLFMTHNPFKYLKLLSDETPKVITASLESNKDDLIKMIVDDLMYGSEGIDAMQDIKRCNDMLSAKGVNVPWLTVPAFVKLVQDYYQKKVEKDIVGWPASAIDTATECNQNGLNIDAMKILASKKDDIIRNILSSIKNDRHSSVIVRSNVKYLRSIVDWPELAMIERSLSSM